MNRPKSSNGRNTLIQNSGRHFVDRVSRCAGCPVRPRGVPALASMAYFPGAGSVPANNRSALQSLGSQAWSPLNQFPGGRGKIHIPIFHCARSNYNDDQRAR